MSLIRRYDREALRRRFQAATPFPFVCIDDFLDPAGADAAAAAYAPFEEARKQGREFRSVNENLKVQIVDPAKFPAPVAAIADAISSRTFLEDLSFITGIQRLVWDPTFAGGGMHQTARSGWLDVHVDFNFNDALRCHRRLNILIYLNPTWDESWGGRLELWDKEVQIRHHAIAPQHNRCIVFATSDTSYHGVTPVQCPPGVQRRSFAAYYYTREAPAGWDGKNHDTIFKARPHELMKKSVWMPASAARHAAQRGVRKLNRGIKRLIGRK